MFDQETNTVAREKKGSQRKEILNPNAKNKKQTMQKKIQENMNIYGGHSQQSCVQFDQQIVVSNPNAVKKKLTQK